MATVQNIIDQALLDIGQIEPGETPTAAETSQALAVANQILASWKADESLHYVARGSGVVAVGLLTLTVGTAGQVATASRPQRIVGARATAGAMQKGLSPLGPRDFSRVVDNQQGTISQVFQAMGVDNAQGTTMNLRFWPPCHTLNTVEVDYTLPLVTAQFGAAGDAVSLLDGGETALRYALSVALAPMHGVGGDQLTALAGLAKQSYDRMVSVNTFVSEVEKKA